MTPQEAKEALKIEQIQIEGKAVRVAKFFEGISVANESLEKQIPKNPIGIYDENIYHIDDDDYIYEPALFGICPVCNKEVQDGMLFCSFCGQALDWGIPSEKLRINKPVR